MTIEAKNYLKSLGMNEDEIENTKNSVFEDTREDFCKMWADTNKINGDDYITTEEIEKHFSLFCGGGNTDMYRVVELSNGNILTMFLNFSIDK